MNLCRHLPFTQMFVLHVRCVSVGRFIPMDSDVIVPFRHSASCRLAIGEFQSFVWDEVSAVWIKKLVKKHEVVIAQGKSSPIVVEVRPQLILDGWSGALWVLGVRSRPKFVFSIDNAALVFCQVVSDSVKEFELFSGTCLHGPC